MQNDMWAREPLLFLLQAMPAHTQREGCFNHTEDKLLTELPFVKQGLLPAFFSLSGHQDGPKLCRLCAQNYQGLWLGHSMLGSGRAKKKQVATSRPTGGQGVEGTVQRRRNRLQPADQQEDKGLRVPFSETDIFKTDSDEAFSLVALLKACAKRKDLQKGSLIHTDIIKRGLLETNVFVGSALVNMYAKCVALDKAQEVLDDLPIRNEVSWNALIAGYAQYGRGEEALTCYVRMLLEGALPSAVTFACILKACGSTGAQDKGQDAHAKIIKAGLLDIEVVVGNALVDMYAKCGLLAKAHALFDELSVWDVVSWNALIAGYAQQEHDEEALKCFEQMQLEGFSPEAVTFTCALKACGHIGVAYKGQEMHANIIRHGVLQNDVVIGTGLVDMYANCGMLEEAQDMFKKMPVRNVVSWSALMVGYAQVGRGEDVFNLFDKMVVEGIIPDLVTLTIVLHTCSHKGLVDKAQKYFEIVSKGYHIKPTLEHHACMIDLFCRVGYLDKAVAMIKEMPYSPNLTTWLTLLSACEKWENVQLGSWAFEHAVQLDETNTATYIFMSNIYVAAGRQGDADKIEVMRIRVNV